MGDQCQCRPLRQFRLGVIPISMSSISMPVFILYSCLFTFDGWLIRRIWSMAGNARGLTAVSCDEEFC
jgi:hypothetical protein